MQINDAGLALIKQFEGCELTAYRDVAGIWTVGWGHVPGHEGQTITQAEADALLAQDIAVTATGVSTGLGAHLTTENQFTAMVCLAFNIGVVAFLRSTLLRYHNNGWFPKAADEFLRWDHAGGKTLDALERRRYAERALYLTP